MSRRVASWLEPCEPYLPALLLLWLSAFGGTFQAPLHTTWVTLGHAAVVAIALFGASRWRDPLNLGRSGPWLLSAIALTLAISYVQSPVPRAGRVALILLPAWLLLPAAVARCWRRPDARRRGLRSVSLVVLAVAAWSLWGWWRFATPGPSLPLGHHNLLATWLVTLLPLAVLVWRDGPSGRILAGLNVLVGGTAILASGSLAGTAALGGTLACASVWGLYRARHRLGGRVFGVSTVALAVALLGLSMLVAPRLQRVFSGEDESTLARQAYFAAGWTGAAERPLFGWGPGAVPWTVELHREPSPGVRPAGEVLADLHSLPLQLIYELGWIGFTLLLGVGVVFVLRHRTAIDRIANDRGDDSVLARAAGLAGIGLAIAGLGGLPLSVTALAAAGGIVVGAVLAAGGRRGWRVDPPSVPMLYVAAVTWLLVPIVRAQLAYDRAIMTESSELSRSELQRAVELDPTFPLYTARLAWLDAELADDGGAGVDRALAAARRAPGVAMLWLEAGLLVRRSGVGDGEAALLRACALDPLAPVAPYLLATGADVDDPRAVGWTARALLAEPMLLAAVEWQRRPGLLRQAVRAVAATAQQLEAGWYEAFLDTARPLINRPWPDPEDRDHRLLRLSLDGDAATSPTLFAFRRRPWPTSLAEVELDAERLATIDLVPASALSSTDPGLFAGTDCGLGAREAPVD